MRNYQLALTERERVPSRIYWKVKFVSQFKIAKPLVWNNPLGFMSQSESFQLPVGGDSKMECERFKVQANNEKLEVMGL